MRENTPPDLLDCTTLKEIPTPNSDDLMNTNIVQPGKFLHWRLIYPTLWLPLPFVSFYLSQVLRCINVLLKYHSSITTGNLFIFVSVEEAGWTLRLLCFVWWQKDRQTQLYPTHSVIQLKYIICWDFYLRQNSVLEK